MLCLGIVWGLQQFAPCCQGTVWIFLFQVVKANVGTVDCCAEREDDVGEDFAAHGSHLSK